MPEEFLLHRSFHSSPPPDEAPSFDIDGERFDCKRSLSGVKYMEYSVMLARGGSISVEAALSFFREAMEPGEHERFMKYINDPDREVDTKTIGDIFQHIWQAYSNRPTKRSEPSGSGPQPQEPTSTES